MDFSQIKYFIALSKTLNFTRAAENCHVTQPTLTQAIQRLEAELGRELIKREGKATQLTRFGETVLSQFEQIERTRLLISEAANVPQATAVKKLNIGLMCTVGPQFISAFFEAFRVENPHVQLCMHSIVGESIDNLLLTGALDGAICARHHSANTRLEYLHLFHEPMVVAFYPGHKFSNSDCISLSALESEQYLDRLHCEFRHELNALSHKKDVSLSVTFSSEREDWIQSMISNKIGVAIMPKYAVVSDGIESCLLTDPELTRSVELVRSPKQSEDEDLESLMNLARSWSWPSSQKTPHHAS